MPKKYLRVSALILPHEREAYAAYRMQPKRESCAALYHALRENMATLERAPLLGKVHKPLDFFSGFRIMVTRGEVYAEIGFYS